MKRKIVGIAVTGGPSAAKTTFLAFIRQKLEEKGYIVFTLPEAATISINAGVSPINSLIGVSVAQKAITTLAYWIENVFRQAAEELQGDRDVVIIYDRGITDSAAYASPELYESILAGLGLHPVQVRDERYKGVIHLVTAAEGAEEFYTLSNNKARYETPEMARVQDRKTRDVWMGHPHWRMIDNSTDLQGKMYRAYNEVLAIIGVPPVEYEKKHIISFDHKDLPAHCQRIEIEQFYPMSNDPNVIPRFRKRGQHGYYSFYRTTKQKLGPGKNIEIEDFTTEARYEASREFIRPDTALVRKIRTCFEYAGQYFELDEFEDPRVKEIIGGDALLELEITEDEKKIVLPPWVKGARDVTGQPAFSNLAIAKALAKK